MPARPNLEGDRLIARPVRPEIEKVTHPPNHPCVPDKKAKKKRYPWPPPALLVAEVNVCPPRIEPNHERSRSFGPWFPPWGRRGSSPCQVATNCSTSSEARTSTRAHRTAGA